eukprot:441393-Prorocentrum_minimum.AAC.1
MPTGCQLDAHWMPTGCPLDANWMPTGCPLDANWMPTGCPLDANWMPALRTLGAQVVTSGSLVEPSTTARAGYACGLAGGPGGGLFDASRWSQVPNPNRLRH